MRQYRALSRGQGTSIAALYWAGCIIDIYGLIYDKHSQRDVTGVIERTVAASEQT
jgi:hypothetical protein